MKGLNPCYTGMEIEPTRHFVAYCASGGLNPCYTGMEIELAQVYEGERTTCLNPCYTGMEIELFHS